MIDESVIEEALEHTEALNRAEERMRKGARTGREAPAQDVPEIVKAGVMWRNIATALWDDIVQRQKDSMSVGEPRKDDCDGG